MRKLELAEKQNNKIRIIASKPTQSQPREYLLALLFT